MHRTALLLAATLAATLVSAAEPQVINIKTIQGKMLYDVFSSNAHVASNTLLILFASFQVIANGLLADLQVRLAKPSREVASAASLMMERGDDPR